MDYGQAFDAPFQPGTQNIGFGRLSHLVDIYAPGADSVRVQQVNYPVLAQELPVRHVGEGHWQVRTLAEVPAPNKPDGEPIGTALLYVASTYPDGSIGHEPNIHRKITQADCNVTAFCSTREGLQLGDNRPLLVGSSTEITIAQRSGRTKTPRPGQAACPPQHRWSLADNSCVPTLPPEPQDSPQTTGMAGWSTLPEPARIGVAVAGAGLGGFLLMKLFQAFRGRGQSARKTRIALQYGLPSRWEH